ncbi:MAG: tRNA (adenosine(37)-N6)-dimethylallyltransferase MiaA [Hylemonella sp.]|jgi:tRNA dimethylallyltransferase
MGADFNPETSANRILALAGPTASGKTAAALALAREIPIEIISVDSALVYRGMDIGTAKPSASERRAVPHHLIDIIDPAQRYNAAEFVRDATRLVTQIHARGRVPLLVGGTLLYFKALFQGLDDLPAANPEVRAAIESEARLQGWPALHAALSQIDPVSAARLAPGDSQRIQRALEVYQITGQPISALQGSTRSSSLFSQTRLICLEPLDRAWLHSRIAQRLDAMFAAGFMQEVQALRSRGDLHLGLPSIRCVGYRQAWEALDGNFPLSELRDRAIYATRQLAKRQITWLRSMPERQVVSCDAPDPISQVLQIARSQLT